MPATLQTFESREAWLENRKKGIGGSDIAAVIGANPWMSNVELWEIKTGRALQEDISGKEVVRYGISAEEHIRALYELDHPDYKVEYAEFNSWYNDEFPWALASLDGWMVDDKGRFGVLEIKTTEIQRAQDWEKWSDHIPQNYFCQVLMYMAITGAEFAELRAAIRYTDREGDRRTTIRDYHIERSDVDEDIKYLMDAGARFWEQVTKDERPALILPGI